MNTLTINPPTAQPRRFAGLLLTAGCAVLMTACASAPVPKEQMAVTRAAIERTSGPTAADAAVEASEARAKFDRANTAVAQKDYVLARQLAEQAEADAALAEAKARAARSSRALNEVQTATRQLREEMAKP